MTYTSFLTTAAWAKGFRRDDAFPAPVDGDSRKAVLVEDLDPEWVHALESANYSHLPKLKKQTA